MIDLIKADLYKEFRKRSFKIVLLLIIFVSILSLWVINKNINLESEQVVVYPLYENDEYKSVNKYGDYSQYVRDYDDYVEVVNIQNELISRNSVSKIQFLLSYSQSFLFVLGVIVVIFAFHSFSYDFSKDTIKYVFMSRQGRKRIFFSKLFSIMILSFILFLVLILVMIIVSMLLTGENLFAIKVWVNYSGSFKEVFYIFEFFRSCFVSIFSYVFMIVFSMFLSIVFKGSNLGLVVSFLVYFASLMFSQILFNYGFMFVKYTFLPYIDFTYFSDKVLVSFNNLIYNLNFSYGVSFVCLFIYSLIFIDLSLWFLKRDV